MGDIVYLRIIGEKQGDISSGRGAYAPTGDRWQVGYEDEIFTFAFTNVITSTGKDVNLQGLQFCKLIDKSSPLLSNAINQNERLFIEIDLYRINRSGRWERYYYAQLRNTSLTTVYVNISNDSLPTECVNVNYDYILYKHLIASAGLDWSILPADYNSLSIPPRSPPASNLNPESLLVVNPPLSPPAVKPVYAKSCLKGKGCTDAGTVEKFAGNFERVTIFALPVADDCCGYYRPEASDVGQPVEAQTMLLFPGNVLTAQMWGKWLLSNILSAICGSYIDALVSALYIPSTGEGSAHVSGRDEFWYEEELRQKALAGSTATARVRFF